MNLIDKLNTELKRAKELLEVYQSIPTGGFGSAIISQTIEFAEGSIRNGDTVGMIRAYGLLLKLK